MSVSILCSGRGASRPTTSPEALARQLATGLAHQANPVVHVAEAHTLPRLQATDLMIISASVSGGAVDPVLEAVLTAGCDLAGTVVFLVSVGPWPAEAGTLERCLRPLIRRSGALCIAPVLHIHSTSAAAIEAYRRYWSPVLPGVVAAGRNLRTVAA